MLRLRVGPLPDEIDALVRVILDFFLQTYLVEGDSEFAESALVVRPSPMRARHAGRRRTISQAARPAQVYDSDYEFVPSLSPWS